jgi:hypothetical protein
LRSAVRSAFPTGVNGSAGKTLISRGYFVPAKAFLTDGDELLGRDRTFEITFSTPGVEAHAFTFG